MLCEKCGNEIPDGSASCGCCTHPAEQTSKKTSKKRTILICTIAAAVLIAGIVLGMIFIAPDNRISMQNYVKVTMEGYDGYGRMTFEFGDVTFGMRVAGDEEAIKFGDRDDKDYFVNYDAEDIAEAYRENLPKAKRLLSSVDITYTLPEGKKVTTLKNGDVITFTVTYNQRLAEDMGLEFKDTTFQYVVEGLKPEEEFDLLAQCQLLAEGTNGFGLVKIVCKETTTKQVGDITFHMEEGKSLIRYTAPDGYSGAITLDVLGDNYNKSNGDVIKSNLNLHARGFEAYGVLLVGLGKEYTVAGLPDFPE